MKDNIGGVVILVTAGGFGDNQYRVAWVDEIYRLYPSMDPDTFERADNVEYIHKSFDGLPIYGNRHAAERVAEKMVTDYQDKNSIYEGFIVLDIFQHLHYNIIR